MAKRPNPYRGILQPKQVGGGDEVSVVVIFDVQEDKVRNKVADVCLNYGLERIQYSAFFGKISRNHRQELALRIQGEIGKAVARVRIIPVLQEALDEMWDLDQYRKPPGSESGLPVLRRVGSYDD